MLIKRTSLTVSLTASALATALAFSMPALAQQEGYGPGGQPDAGAQQPGAEGAPPAPAAPPAPEPQPQVQAEDLDDEKLEAFAAAFVEVDKIRGEYEPQLQGVEDPAQAMEIQQEANEQMVEAIEREGLDPETYNAIAMAAGPDEQLRDRLLNMIEERQQN